MILDQPEMNRPDMNHDMHDMNEAQLSSWKEIGAYLQRNEATARRWEREEGLPVHRHTHKKRSSVYAFPSEIDSWRATRKVIVEQPVSPWWRTVLIPSRSLAFAATILVCLLMVGSGVRPASAEARGNAKATRQISTVPGVTEISSVSADGRFISYSEEWPGDVVVRDLNKGATHRLTRRTRVGEGADEKVLLSPDGAQVAYGWYDDLNNSAGKFSLRILPRNKENGTPRNLLATDGGETAWPFGWSPDGKQLFIVRQLADHTEQIAAVSLQDGALRNLKSVRPRIGFASLSPDGRFIAYESRPSDAAVVRDIYVMTADGSRDNAIVESPADDSAPVWSPDGSRVLFLSDRTGNSSLWAVPVQEGRAAGPAEVIKPDIGDAEIVGMDGRGDYYFYTHGFRRNVWVAELGPDGKAAQAPALVTERYANSNGQPSWSPDGQYLAYYSFRPQGIRQNGMLLVIRTLKTGEERDIPLRLGVIGPHFIAPPKWFPDGRSVLAVMVDPAIRGLGYYRVDVATGNPERLANGGNVNPSLRPDLSPDGRALFFVAAADSPGANSRLMRFDLEKKTGTELKRAPGGSFQSLSVSPDGKQLAFLQMDQASRSGSLQVMPAGGGESRELFREADWDGDERHLAWTPDQRYLVLTKPENPKSKTPAVLWRVPLSGGAPEELGVAMTGVRFPAVHPDGKRVAFEVREAGPTEVWTLENFLPKTVSGKR